jgi:hypothetical protein
MQRHICSVCIAEHQKSGAGGCVFPDCTAPETAIPAAELPTDQLILAKMSEAATSVSVKFAPVMFTAIGDRLFTKPGKGQEGFFVPHRAQRFLLQSLA